jgi:hypothetical protein
MRLARWHWGGSQPASTGCSGSSGCSAPMVPKAAQGVLHQHGLPVAARHAVSANGRTHLVQRFF